MDATGRTGGRRLLAASVAAALLLALVQLVARDPVLSGRLTSAALVLAAATVVFGVQSHRPGLLGAPQSRGSTSPRTSPASTSPAPTSPAPVAPSPVDRAPTWPAIALAAGLLLAAAGAAVHAAIDAGDRAGGPFAADLLDLAPYPLWAAALVALAGRRPVPAVAAVDAAVVAVTVALPLWLLVGAAGAPSGSPQLAADLLLLVVLTAVARPLRPVGAAEVLVLVGLGALLLADVALVAVGPGHQWLGVAPEGTSRYAHAVLWGAAALVGTGLRPRPTSVGATASLRGATRRRGGLLVGALLLAAPLAAVLVGATGDRGEPVAVVGLSALVAALALARAALAQTDLRAVLARLQTTVALLEQLSEASRHLVAARSSREAQRAAVAAALQLVTGGPTARGAAALAVGPPELLEVVATDALGVAPEQAARLDLALLTHQQRSGLGRGQELLLPVVAPDHPDDLLLALPLRSLDRTTGLLVVAGPREQVLRTAPVLRALAAQVALSLEGARLRDRPTAPGEVPRGLPSTAVLARLSPGQLIGEMHRGLREGEFVVHYQPIVRLDTGACTGFEALVRWQHPVQGLLSPQVFLPVLEECGLLGQLDAHVLSQACRQAVRFDRRGDGPYVAVNTSAVQLLSPRFPPTYGQC